jgi:hypothetical protein
MDLAGVNWTIIDIVAPILLILGLAFAVIRNRTRRGQAKTDEGTRAVYDEAEQARRRGD